MPARTDLCDLPGQQPTLRDAPTGRVVAELSRYLAAGSSAAVFAGKTPAGTAVAVKILLPKARRELLRRGMDPQKLFDREREAHDAVGAIGGSPSLCPVLDHGITTVALAQGVLALPFLVTSLVPEEPHGATLEERVLRAGRGVPLPRARRLLAGVFAGTAALHRAGIVHRDLSPGNILVRGPLEDEETLVADGGIARVPNTETLGLAARTSSYGSPEQALVTAPAPNPLVGFRSDVHAVAALAFFVLAGRGWAEIAPAFPRGERAPLPRELLDATVRPRADALDLVLARGASPRLALAEPRDLLARLPQSSAAPRYETLAELRAELWPLLEDDG